MVPELLQCHVSLATPFAQEVLSLSSQLNNFLSYLDKMLLLPQSLSQLLRDCVLHMPCPGVHIPMVRTVGLVGGGRDEEGIYGLIFSSSPGLHGRSSQPCPFLGLPCLGLFLTYTKKFMQ